MFHNSLKNILSSLFDGCELFCLSALVSISLHLYTHALTLSSSTIMSHCDYNNNTSANLSTQHLPLCILHSQNSPLENDSCDFSTQTFNSLRIQGAQPKPEIPYTTWPLATPSYFSPFAYCSTQVGLLAHPSTHQEQSSLRHVFCMCLPSLLCSSSDVYVTCSLFTPRSPLICVLIQGSFLDQTNKNNP